MNSLLSKGMLQLRRSQNFDFLGLKNFLLLKNLKTSCCNLKISCLGAKLCEAFLLF